MKLLRIAARQNQDLPLAPLHSTLTGEGLLERTEAPHGPLIDPRRLVYVRGLKRFGDICLSVVALAFFLPLFPVIALAIRIDSPGPVLFMQTRIGLDRRRRYKTPCAISGERRQILYPGRPFRMFKLRTMRIDAEKYGPQWAKAVDDRVTRIGAALRKTRLDEVPQFINVLRGEMSVIGPRPERLCFIRQFEQEVPHYHDRLSILPGITGLAQVINGYDTDGDSVRRKVNLDRQYIQSLSLRTDLRILLMTVNVLVNGRGAH